MSLKLHDASPTPLPSALMKSLSGSLRGEGRQRRFSTRRSGLQQKVGSVEDKEMAAMRRTLRRNGRRTRQDRIIETSMFTAAMVLSIDS